MFPAEKPFFSTVEVEEIQKLSIPEHVAIIMDGNRRWAKQKSCAIKDAFNGHFRGARVLEEIIGGAIELGIKVITVYCFSTENRGRSKLEVDTLVHLFETYLRENCQKMVERGIRFDVIGTLVGLPASVQEAIIRVREATKRGESLDLVCAFNYGARDEICRAAKKIAQDCLENKIAVDSLSEKLFSSYLDTARWKDPDLLIRTGQEMRISNFLLWQLAYAEFYITDLFWPDFTAHEFLKAIRFYQNRERRLGK